MTVRARKKVRVTDLAPARAPRSPSRRPRGRAVPVNHDQLKSWFEVALNNMARGLSMFDAQARLIVCNSLYREIYDLPLELTRPGTPFSKIIRYHAARETGAETKRNVASQERWIKSHVGALSQGRSFNHTQTLRDGRTILVSNQPLPHGGWVDLQEDITERRRAEEKIVWLARHDTLTELPNRFHFQEQLDTALKDGARIAIHWIDLDHYKAINDELGHPVGDALLASVATRLKSVVRTTDLVARLGGDEFAVIQQNATSRARVLAFAKRLINSLPAPHLLMGHKVKITASIGVAMSPDHGNDTATLLKNADVALYRAKAKGRNAFAIFEKGDNKPADGHVVTKQDLKDALDAGEFELHYQPIIDVKQRFVTSCEALMRWRHKTRGLIPPNDFIPIAEQCGMIVELGAWAIERACADATTWPDKVKVNVNLSPRQFESGNLYASAKAALKRSGLAPARLEFEITETALLKDDAGTHDMLHKLKRLGVCIALDDFGTAYASLSYLRSFPFDKIKIDRSFIRDLNIQQSGDCFAIIDAVVGLARQLKMTTVAEGVETVEQLDTISFAGCGEVQGFYFSRPVAAADVCATIERCNAMSVAPRSAPTPKL
jgi:diguanylate cyclase (GGDEF)-like protein